MARREAWLGVDQGGEGRAAGLHSTSPWVPWASLTHARFYSFIHSANSNEQNKITLGLPSVFQVRVSFRKGLGHFPVSSLIRKYVISNLLLKN